jgi:hypothetical protein
MANSVNPNSNQGKDQENNGSEPVDLGQSQYNFKYTVFPNDLGMDNNGHYMIININVPSDSRRTKARGRYETIDGERIFTPLKGEASKVDKLRYGPTGTIRPAYRPNGGLSQYLNPIRASAAGLSLLGIQQGGGPGDTSYLSLQRKTMRIAESIALHMPTPLVYNTHNAYEEISLSALGFKLGSAGLTAVTSAVTAAIARSIESATAAGAAARTITNGLGQVVSTGSKLMQSPINPAVEILFSNTLVRQFTLEVMMAPRNEQESLNMKAIIKTLRFHGAPELTGLFDSSYFEGLFWIPPAEFDITFFNKGVENMNILRINTCVLERIEVDYAPTGVYSTFRNGHPVAARLSLGFRELEANHKKRILQGF